MTKQHLYPSAFWNWRGWDFIKWPFALFLLAGILWVIWTKAQGRQPIGNMPAPIESIINAIDESGK